MWCSACTVITSRVQCLWFWCLGRCEVSRSEGQTPPDPKGWTCAAAAPDTLADLLGARAERVPDCSSYLSRIPGGATDSGSVIHPRDSRGSRGGRPHLAPSDARHHALLKVLRLALKAPLEPRGSKMRALNSAGIRARSSPLLGLKNLRA